MTTSLTVGKHQVIVSKKTFFVEISINNLIYFTARKTSVNDNSNDDMQEELKNVLTLFRDRRKNLDIVGNRKTPEVFIQQTSNPAEVEQWLTAKGFSERTVKKLHGLTGNELFALNRKTLEDYCGTEDGKRLASQITIQRNISGVRFSFLLAFLFNLIHF